MPINVMDPNNTKLPSMHTPEPAVSQASPASDSLDADPVLTTAAPAPASMPAPAMADDADLIEKEWVLKARQIVEQTKADPFVQNQQMNQMKADYIKKRYNKDLKVEGS